MNENLRFMQMNIRNAARIAELHHGQFLSIGVGNVVIEVMTYIPTFIDDDGSRVEDNMVYDFQVLQSGEEVEQVSHTSLAHVLNRFAFYSMVDFTFAKDRDQ